MRRRWLAQTDDELLADCEVDRFRASGPGGQKRNKTESAIRLRHQPSGLSARAVESRSQHENREVALQRLRVALAIETREPPSDLEDRLAEMRALSSVAPRGPKARLDPDYLNAIGEVLDILAGHEMNLRATAERIGIGSAALARIIKNDPAAHRWVNAARSRLDLGPVR